MDQINNFDDILKSKNELFISSDEMKKLSLNVILHTRPFYINSKKELI